MDQIKLIEFLFTYKAILVLFAVTVWLLTYVVKKPIKAATAKIKDERKRKLANKWVLLIPFILAFIAVYLYLGFTTVFWPINWQLLTQDAFKVAFLAIVIYNVAEGLKGKKTEYQTDEAGAALYELLLIYAKDPTKVKLLLDQCKENYKNGSFEISDTVKGWLPPGVDADVVNTIVKSIKRYLDIKSEDKSHGGELDGLK